MNEKTTTAMVSAMRKLIEEDGRTQKELATNSGISQQIVSEISTGTAKHLRAEVVARLCRTLGVQPAALGRLLYESFPEKNPES